MAKNPPIGDNSRRGRISNRSQVLNPKTNLFVKRDTTTGQFIAVKSTGGKYKSVRLEK